ncbi:MAG: histidine kinase [Thermoleophilia bacterium]
MRDFFQQNQTILLFAHGLVFFSLGFAVWLQRRRASRLVLTNALIWLAAYACVEAFAVWGRAFIPVQRSYLAPDLISVLLIVRGVLQTMAFLFLLEFGLRLVVQSPRRRRAVSALAAVAWAGLLLISAAVGASRGWSVADWERSASASARLVLLLPAALMAATGVWRQRGELADAGMVSIKPYAAAMAAVLTVYAVLAGLIIDPAPWVPSVVRADTLFGSTEVPLALLRGFAGLALCVLAVKLLEIFEVEAKQRLDALERARTVAEERARFRRDLHDGTIQSIFAAALHLEAITLRMPDTEIRGEVRDVITDLNTVTNDIRRYITDLAETPDTPTGIADRLSNLATEFSQETGVTTQVRVGGVAVSGPIPDGAGRHLEHILREALSNAARHAHCTATMVSLTFAPDELELVVGDDGRGLVPPAGDHGGQGLRNMRERARRMGGRLTIDGAPGDTRIVVSVPLDSEFPELVPPHRPFPEVIPS